MDTNRVAEIVEHFIGYLHLDELLARLRAEYEGDAQSGIDLTDHSYDAVNTSSLDEDGDATKVATSVNLAAEVSPNRAMLRRYVSAIAAERKSKLVERLLTGSPSSDHDEQSKADSKSRSASADSRLRRDCITEAAGPIES